MYLRLLLLALSALLACSLSSGSSALAKGDSPDVDLLLVVGLVTETKARILYEALVDEWDGAEVEVVVAVGSGEGRASPVTTVTPRRFAQVVEVPGLQENTAYNVSFRTATRNEAVTFKTMVSPTTAARDSSVSLQQRLVVFSCDRHGEKPAGDDFVNAMVKREAGKYDVMVHLGDNIYADQYAASQPGVGFDAALEGVRSLYRTLWSRRSMSTLLRHGSHWMLPDDHEVLNALSPAMIERGENLGFIYAARRAAYEYELQLHTDIPPMSKAQEPGCEIFYRAYNFGNTGYLFLDTRFIRSFINEDKGKYPLTGAEQFEFVADTLKAWGARNDIKNIVGFTSVPMFRPTTMGALITDAFEGDKYPLHPHMQQNTLSVLDAFLQAGETKDSITIFSGDFHCYFESRICRKTPSGAEKCLDSIITSGIARGSESLLAPHLLLLTTLDFGPFSPQIVRDEVTGNVWTETEYSTVFPLNNYAILEANRQGRTTWTKVLRDPDMFESVLLTVWCEYGKIAAPIGLALLAYLLLSLVAKLLKAVFGILRVALGLVVGGGGEKEKKSRKKNE